MRYELGLELEAGEVVSKLDTLPFTMSSGLTVSSELLGLLLSAYIDICIALAAAIAEDAAGDINVEPFVPNPLARFVDVVMFISTPDNDGRRLFIFGLVLGGNTRS